MLLVVDVLAPPRLLVSGCRWFPPVLGRCRMQIGRNFVDCYSASLRPFLRQELYPEECNTATITEWHGAGARKTGQPRPNHRYLDRRGHVGCQSEHRGAAIGRLISTATAGSRQRMAGDVLHIGASKYWSIELEQAHVYSRGSAASNRLRNAVRHAPKATNARATTPTNVRRPIAFKTWNESPYQPFMITST